jgi:hypothetical protein
VQVVVTFEKLVAGEKPRKKREAGKRLWFRPAPASAQVLEAKLT